MSPRCQWVNLLQQSKTNTQLLKKTAKLHMNISSLIYIIVPGIIIVSFIIIKKHPLEICSTIKHSSKCKDCRNNFLKSQIKTIGAKLLRLIKDIYWWQCGTIFTQSLLHTFNMLFFLCLLWCPNAMINILSLYDPYLITLAS